LDKNRNRQKSVLTPGILQDIQTAITRSTHKSLRKLSAQTKCSCTCKDDIINFIIYRMSAVTVNKVTFVNYIYIYIYTKCPADYIISVCAYKFSKCNGYMYKKVIS
jgi:hypothetical protein